MATNGASLEDLIKPYHQDSFRNKNMFMTLPTSPIRSLYSPIFPVPFWVPTHEQWTLIIDMEKILECQAKRAELPFIS